jgi:hypothetical protein
MGATTFLVDPTARPTQVQAQAMVDRPVTLDGVVLGLREFWAGYDRYTAVLERLLRERFSLREVQRVDGTHPRTGRVLERWQRFGREVEVAVVGFGACGGCAPWAAMDAMELESRGVPTVTLVSPELAGVAQRTSDAKGYPLRYVYLTQYLDDLDDDGIEQLAKDTVDEIVDQLVRPLP